MTPGPESLPRGSGTVYYAAIAALLPTAVIMVEGFRGTYKKREAMTLAAATIIGAGAMIADIFAQRRQFGPKPVAPVPDKPGYVQA